MERTPVVSSNINSIGYDASSSILEVEFKSGIYQYFGVPEYIYDELMSADSQGVYLNANVKGTFHYEQI